MKQAAEENHNMKTSRLRPGGSFKQRHPKIIHVNIGAVKNVGSIKPPPPLKQNLYGATLPGRDLDNHQKKTETAIQPFQTRKILLPQANNPIMPPYQKTNSFQQNPFIPKKSIYSRRCIIISGTITLVLILGITAIPLALLIKPKSTVTSLNTPVLRWNSSGITVAGITNISGTASNQLNMPIDVILDYAYNFYIVDFGNHRVQKYSLGSSFGTTVCGNGTCGSSASQLCFPGRVILDSNGNFYVADSAHHRVQFWSNGANSGTTIAGVTNSHGNSSNLLFYPYGIALNPTSGELYISDSYNQRIMSYAPGAKNGTLIFGGNGPGNNNNQLNYAIGLHFDSLSNNFISANTNANNIVRFASGASTWTIVSGNSNGVAGTTSTDLIGPCEATFDPMGNMYVADQYNYRIQFFYPDQINSTTIAGISGTSGSNATTLYNPTSVRLDNQLNLYVADFNNHRIQKFLRY